MALRDPRAGPLLDEHVLRTIEMAKDVQNEDVFGPRIPSLGAAGMLANPGDATGVYGQQPGATCRGPSVASSVSLFSSLAWIDLSSSPRALCSSTLQVVV